MNFGMIMFSMFFKRPKKHQSRYVQPIQSRPLCQLHGAMQTGQLGHVPGSPRRPDEKARSEHTWVLSNGFIAKETLKKKKHKQCHVKFILNNNSYILIYYFRNDQVVVVGRKPSATCRSPCWTLQAPVSETPPFECAKMVWTNTTPVTCYNLVITCDSLWYVVIIRDNLMYPLIISPLFTSWKVPIAIRKACLFRLRTACQAAWGREKQNKVLRKWNHFLGRFISFIFAYSLVCMLAALDFRAFSRRLGVVKKEFWNQFGEAGWNL